MTEERERQERLFKAYFEEHVRTLTADGLYAGFAFTGTLQILSLSDFTLLHTVAAMSLMMAVLLFALRISIAGRLVWAIHIRDTDRLRQDFPRLMFPIKLGRVLKSAAILAFWFSLVPLAFQHHRVLGMCAATLIGLAFIAYYSLLYWWNRLNRDWE